MNLKCKIGLHDWKADCEKCSNCEKTRNEQHDWSRNCEKCSKCSASRPNYHQFDNGLCKTCGRGSFTDLRDGNTYKIIRIGNQVLFAENLRYQPQKGNYLAYEGKNENLKKYGYLYDWEMACKSAKNVKGWHLPTEDEWEIFTSFINKNYRDAFKALVTPESSGFDALLGGYSDNERGFLGMNTDSCFWSSTDAEEDNEAINFLISKAANLGYVDQSDRNCGFSVRLFRD